MKLNLLPTHVSKEKATKGALFGSIFLFLLCVVFALFLFSKGKSDFTASTDGLGQLEGEAQRAKDTADYADVVIARSKPLLRNTNLAKEMLAHNAVYPRLYDKVNQYVPSFFRVNSYSASAVDASSSQVTMVGVIDTYQQYADLMLALLRIPRVRSVSRAGFTNDSAYVPGLTADDQVGKPHKPGEAPIPDDPAKRLDYFLSQGKVTGYLGAGGFGSGQDGLRGAMPTSQQITVTVVVSDNLMSPDPRATLSSGSGDAAAATASAPAASGGNLPNTTTPPAPTSSAPVPTRKGRRGSNVDDTGD